MPLIDNLQYRSANHRGSSNWVMQSIDRPNPVAFIVPPAPAFGVYTTRINSSHHCMTYM